MGKTLDFIYRLTKPEIPTKGWFYWVNSDKVNQIWFSPGNDPDEMILLNEDFEPIKEQLQEVKSKMNDIDAEIKKINIYLDSLDDNLRKELEDFITSQGYLTRNDLDEYTTSYLQKNLKKVNGNELFGTGNIEIKTEVKIDDKTKQDIINQVKNEVETRPFKWTVID